MHVDARNCGNPKAIRLVQVCRSFKVDETTQVRQAVAPDADLHDRHDPQRHRLERAGYVWDDKKNEWVAGPNAASMGWRVDSSNASGSPWFSGESDEDVSIHGRSGVNGQPAIQRDAPGTFVDRAYNVGKEFRTCAVAYDEQGRGAVLATIDWGYYCDVHGNVTFDMPSAYAGANVEVFDASDRWNALRETDARDKPTRHAANKNTGLENPYKTT
jgi:hypothetical protein